MPGRAIVYLFYCSEFTLALRVTFTPLPGLFRPAAFDAQHSAAFTA